MSLASGKWSNARGEELVTLECVPEGGTKAVLIWHHGLNEHAGRYHLFFKTLAAAGIAAYSYDASGFGKSQPDDNERAKIARFQDLIDDALAYTDHVKQKADVTVPMFIGGQSLGGLIAADAATQGQDKYAGCMLCSSAIGVELTNMMKFQNMIAPVIVRLMPWGRIVDAVRLEDLSQDQAVIDDYVADPLNFPGKIRVKTVRNIFLAQQDFQKRWKDNKLPVYAHHGSADKTTSLAWVKRYLEGVGSDDITFHVIPGGYHELLKGPEKEDVMQKMVDWLKEKISSK